VYISQSVSERFPLFARFQTHFRSARVAKFVERLQVSSLTSILDIGGEPYFWSDFPVKCKVVCLNLNSPGETIHGIETVQFDGRTFPFEDKSFDIAHSNSVIEQVGDFRAQMRFAAEIRRVGRRFWVQTPNYYFPIEPHAFFPFYQFLPANMKMAIRNVWKMAPYPMEDLLSIRLLTVREMRFLFPEACIYRERAFGVTKSICAYQ